MLENEKKIPEVEFTFREEEKSEEERKNEIENLLKKRNELLVLMGIVVPSTNETEKDEMDDHSPRHGR